MHYPDTPNLKSVLGNVFTRLSKNSEGTPWVFIYSVGRARDAFGNPYNLYSLYKPNKSMPYAPATQAERDRAYRERKKVKVPSVFQFRGQIQLQGEVR